MGTMKLHLLNFSLEKQVFFFSRNKYLYLFTLKILLVIIFLRRCSYLQQKILTTTSMFCGAYDGKENPSNTKNRKHATVVTWNILVNNLPFRLTNNMKRPVWLPHENEPHSISLWINLSSIVFQIKSIDVILDPISKLGDMALLSIDSKS